MKGDIVLRCSRKVSARGWFVSGTRSRRMQVGIACASIALGLMAGFWGSLTYGCILLTVSMLWPSPRSVRALEESTPETR